MTWVKVLYRGPPVREEWFAAPKIEQQVPDQPFDDSVNLTTRYQLIGCLGQHSNFRLARIHNPLMSFIFHITKRQCEANPPLPQIHKVQVKRIRAQSCEDRASCGLDTATCRTTTFRHGSVDGIVSKHQTTGTTRS